MPYITFSCPVNASLATVWNVVVDKIENPTRYNPAASDYMILERFNDGVLRQMKALNMTIKERIVVNEKAREIRHTLVENPLFTGKTVNTVVQPSSNNPNDPIIISYTMDWEPVNQEAQKIEQEIKEKLIKAVQQAVISAKIAAEQQEAQIATISEQNKVQIMSQKIIDLLQAAFNNPAVQAKLQAADTAEKFVRVSGELGYNLTPDELGAGLGKLHGVFGNVVQSMMDKLTGDSPPPNGKAPVSEKNIDLVKRLFSRGEAFDSEGFITFFTDTPVYQFGNFDVCLNKAAIKQSADNFFSRISAVYHEIKAMWEEGDAVFVEMDVAYWRKDGSMITLPCFDIFRVEGDKFSELRIFMDVNPVFNPSIPVPKTASVFTASQGKKLFPPGTMRRHFAEHPEGKERVTKGYVPKWSIDGPKWAIGNINMNPVTIDKSNQLFTVIVVFQVEPSKQQELVDNIVNYLETHVKKLPGFVSSNLHRSLDGTRVVNYAQWESPEFFQASIGGQMKEYEPKIFASIPPDGHAYEVAYQVVV